jgi:hypothetical protein
VFVQATFKALTTGNYQSIAPYQSDNNGLVTTFPLTGAGFFTVGLPGRLDSSLVASLVLSAITGTPAKNASHISLTAAGAIYAENFNMNTMLGPTLRKLPTRYRLYPYMASVGGVSSPIFFSVA